jgi:topoisomerase-4 subunit A
MGLKIVADIRKDSDANMILNYFYKNTDLQVYYNYNNVTIIDRRPVQVGLLGLLDAFIAFRKEVVTRRSKYELARMEARCHVIEGLMKAVSVLDEVIAIIRHSKDKGDAKKNLMKEFGFDEPQAEAIVTLRLYRLTNTDITALRGEFAELANKIEETRAILDNPDVMRHVIASELKAVKAEYGDARRTKLEDKVAELVIDKTSMITNERVVATVSRDGYVKKVSMRSYQASEGQLTGLKAGDELIGAIECDTVDTLLLFTSRGNYAYLPVWQIDDGKWKETGSHLNKVIRIDGEDKIIAAVLVKNFETWGWIITVSSLGQIKKSRIKDFAVQRNSRVMPAMSLKKNDTLITAFAAYKEDQILILSRDGFANRYSIDQIPTMGIKTRGVKAQNYGKGDSAGGACVVGKDAATMLFVTENGMMKRVKLEEIPENNRPAKGNLICKRIKSNPSVLVYTRTISPGDELEFYDPEKQTIRASDIALKPVTTSFSQPLVLKKGWYILKGIEEARIIDIPEGEEEEAHSDVETMTLFDLEGDA